MFGFSRFCWVQIGGQGQDFESQPFGTCFLVGQGRPILQLLPIGINNMHKNCIHIYVNIYTYTHMHTYDMIKIVNAY